jgi:hypothetical protein
MNTYASESDNHATLLVCENTSSAYNMYSDLFYYFGGRLGLL